MRLTLFILGCLLHVSSVFAEDLALPLNLNLYTLNVSEDKTVNQYRQVVRHKNGYLWIVTGRALQRYDGYSLKRYELLPDDATSDFAPIISALETTRDGTLWVASGDQLHRHDVEKDSFTSKVVLHDKTIRNLFESSDGTLWLSGDGMGLVSVDPVTMMITDHYLDSPAPIDVYDLAPANQTDHVWVANKEHLLLFNTQQRRVEATYPQISKEAGIDVVDDLLQDQQGYVWAATFSGLYRLDPRTGERKHYAAKYQRPNGIKSKMVRSLLEDNEGRLWIGTDKRGLHVYRPETDDFAHYPSSESNTRFLPVDPIRHMFQDDEGTIWLSMNSFGIRKFNLRLNKFEPFFSVEDDPNTLSSNNIMDIHEAQDGTLWIGTDGAGLNHFNPYTNTTKRYRHDVADPNTLSSDAVLNIDEDADGNLWLGTWAGGVNFFNTETEQFTRYERQPEQALTHTLGSHNVFHVKVANSEQILLSSWKYGLQILNPKTGEFSNYTHNAGEHNLGDTNSINIRSITPDTEANIYWLSSLKGLERFDLRTGKAEVIDVAEFGAVNEVYVESDTRIWVASQYGLFEYAPKTQQAKQHIISEDWAKNTIRSIEPDKHNRLWLGTRNGFAVFDKTTHQSEFFDAGDGLAGTRFNFFSHASSQDGYLYFGTAKGLNRFKPGNFPRNTTLPQLYLTKIQLGQTTLSHKNSEYLSSSLEHTKTLILPYHESNISFEFAALNFIDPNKNRYRYRLTGFDKDWISTDSSQRWAHYTNLPHGDYIFEVEASNNDDVWTPQPTQLRICITPPWWALWWVRIGFVFLSIGLMYGLTSWRVWHIKRREQQLNKIVAERTNELQTEKDKVDTLNQELEQRVVERTKALSNEVVERRKAQDRLYHLAYHDVLTGLPNRSWLLSQLSSMMNQPNRDTIGVIFLDGDRFKRINDTYGHLVGDELLNAAAMRLKNVLGEGQTAIRLGGDEFVVLAKERVTLGTMRLLAQAIVDAFSEAFAIRHYVFDFQVSAGVALCDQGYKKAEECLRDADIAMYEAKQQGRGNYQFFNNSMRERELAQNQLESDLKHAIQENQFRIEYAPILSATNKQLFAVEALLSWHHPEHGVLDADRLFALAEDNGQAYEIAVWLFEHICLQLANWQAHLGTPLTPRVMIPLSEVQINVQGLIGQFSYIAKQRDVNPKTLLLELPEAVLLNGNVTTTEQLEAFQTLGFDVVINHFGSGHGALTHLHELPINHVKLDGALLERIAQNNNSLYEVTKATTSLCQNLNIGVIASGINSSDQWLLAQRLNCHFVQGSVIGDAMRTTELALYLGDQKRQNLSS